MHRNIRREGWLDNMSGFSLLELVIILVILSILAFFAAPVVTEWGPKMRLKGAVDRIVEDLQRAKIHAIKHGLSVKLQFYNATPSCPGGSYNITDSDGTEVVVYTISDLLTDDGKRTSNVCLLSSTYATAAPFDGFTSRGLPVNPATQTLTLVSNELGLGSGSPKYDIVLTTAGGISSSKGVLP